MSGGSYNYIYSSLQEACCGYMYDPEMNDMIKDLCKVLKALEWWQSADWGEEAYRKELSRFKNKWFKKERTDRLKKYIDEQIGTVKTQLYAMLCDTESEEE